MEEEKQSIEKLKKQITIGKCEKNIGIPVYISDLETVLNLIEKKDKMIDLMAKEYVCKGKKNTSCNIYITKKYSSCKECVIEKFRKKVENYER